MKTPIREAIVAVESAYEDLKGLSLLLRRIEAERFDAAPLRALLEKLSSHTLSASATFTKLATIVNFVEARRNPILAPFLLLIMYPLQAALAAERWRSAHGAAIPAWLDVLGEIESLVSLAQYAYEHPGDPFPEFTGGAASFQAVDLGHPLIPAAVRVCNDVDISGATRVLLVSGSNMSGKSTLLRTVGINTVLAMAGAPGARTAAADDAAAASAPASASMIRCTRAARASTPRSRGCAGYSNRRSCRCCFSWMNCCRERIRRIGGSGRRE